jgi:hypothetical protein
MHGERWKVFNLFIFHLTKNAVSAEEKQTAATLAFRPAY